MYELIVVFSKKWPWVRLGRSPAPAAAPIAPARVEVQVNKYPPVVVRLSNGEYGVIHHYKIDGKFGVRPVTPAGDYIPNSHSHWTAEQNQAMPVELALLLTEFSAVAPFPEWAK